MVGKALPSLWNVFCCKSKTHDKQTNLLCGVLAFLREHSYSIHKLEFSRRLLTCALHIRLYMNECVCVCVVFDIAHFFHVEEQKQSRILQRFQLQLTEPLRLYIHNHKITERRCTNSSANMNAFKPIKQKTHSMVKYFSELSD